MSEPTEPVPTNPPGDGVERRLIPEVWPGAPFPLGTTWDGEGVNVAVWSSTASAVTVCLFDKDGVESQVPLTERTYNVWHGYLPGVSPGQRYGFRMDGRFEPARGLLHSPAKLLVDPYARAVEGDVREHPSLYLDEPAADSAAHVPRSVVVHDMFPWGGDRPPGTAWEDTVIYEMHVRGFTKRLPGVPEELRGTYAGLGHPVSVDYLKGLGVTAVELLPVHQFVAEPHLQRRGLSNYWGYNSLSFFAPQASYASRRGPSGKHTPANSVREFKAMVRSLHEAGIEVILDVVYNHTAEGGIDGPTLSYRGIDNPSYYRADPSHPARYLDYTGCGNTVDVRRPFVLQMVMDSLRYWVQEMHVDGFRFDLASALARSLHDVDKLSAFFDTIHQDPVISRVKLIAEPWDVGHGGYQVGQFPPLWTEWNGMYRDTIRSFWSDGDGGVRELAYRLAGSSDLYRNDGRAPLASINFVTAHDGFTLRDLVSYARKHNEANGENNRDGTDDNRSTNGGIEGETSDPVVIERRLRRARNLLVTLLLSTGVPMLTAGDERWRTQGGNNNAYAQDNEISWLDWTPSDEADDLTRLTRHLIGLRRRSPVLRQTAFFEGHLVPGGGGSKDLAWFAPSGQELSGDDWHDTSLRTLGMYLDGRGLRHRGPRGEGIVDESYLLVLHAGEAPIAFTLPSSPWADEYEVVIDTRCPAGQPEPPLPRVAGDQQLAGGTSLLLRVIRS